MIDSRDMTADGIANLCGAVIVRAIKDYRTLCQRVEECQRRGRKPNARDLDEIERIEKFFLSDRFKLFAGDIDFEYLADKLPELRSAKHEE